MISSYTATERPTCGWHSQYPGTSGCSIWAKTHGQDTSHNVTHPHTRALIESINPIGLQPQDTTQNRQAVCILPHSGRYMSNLKPSPSAYPLSRSKITYPTMHCWTITRFPLTVPLTVGSRCFYGVMSLGRLGCMMMQDRHLSAWRGSDLIWSDLI